ncbi:hypothetical protein D3C83_295590 [compost metagenome]
MELPHALDESARGKLRAAIAEAFVAGFRWVMLIAAALAAASAVIAWFTIGGKPRIAS